jgi:hypothetical protein
MYRSAGWLVVTGRTMTLPSLIARLALPGLLLWCGAGVAWAGTPLPPSQRLDPVRPALEQLIARAEQAGVPSELIVSKVREGLAKGIPPETIRAVAERLARDLGDATQVLRVNRKADASPGLVRALAEARAAGVEAAVLLPLVEARVSDALVVRALETVTELSVRGYPGPRAAFVIQRVVEHDPEAVGRVVAGVESIRRAQTISRADSLGALARNLASVNGSFESALNRSLEGSEHGAGAPGNGKGNGQGNDHGNSVSASKKNMGMKMK